MKVVKNFVIKSSNKYIQAGKTLPADVLTDEELANAIEAGFIEVENAEVAKKTTKKAPAKTTKAKTETKE